MTREISPPPTKRRKTSKSTSQPVTSEPDPNTTTPGPPAPNNMRIFSWNINGITPFLQKPITSFFPTSPRAAGPKSSIHSPSLRHFLHRHHWPAMLFLQEVKIANRDTKTQDAVRAAINASLSPLDHGPKYDAYFTLPTDAYNARGPNRTGKVYGVCSIIHRDLHTSHAVAVRTVDWDKEGRVSVVELTTGPNKLAVFNIYAVNGTDFSYRDPQTGAPRGTRHQRKRAFQRLLAAECAALQCNGWDVLLGGDINVAPDERDGWPRLRVFPEEHVRSRADFHAELLGRGERESGDGTGRLRGVDVWREMHGEERRYTYFPRGREWGTSCDRVDYFVAGRGAWEKGLVRDCGILDSEAERGSSDHVPIWVDVCFSSVPQEE